MYVYIIKNLKNLISYNKQIDKKKLHFSDLIAIVEKVVQIIQFYYESYIKTLWDFSQKILKRTINSVVLAYLVCLYVCTRINIIICSRDEHFETQISQTR